MELLPTFIEDAECSRGPSAFHGRDRRESEPPKEPEQRSGPIFDDVPWWRPPGSPKHHIYQQYFTPAERRRLKAIPENDVTSEIQLLRVLLVRCFAMVPRFPHDSKIAPLSLKLHIEMVTVFAHVATVIGSLAGLQWKMHKPVDELGKDILQALREMNPYEDLC
jgi:hypothetical protein